MLSCISTHAHNCSGPHFIVENHQFLFGNQRILFLLMFLMKSCDCCQKFFCVLSTLMNVRFLFTQSSAPETTKRYFSGTFQVAPKPFSGGIQSPATVHMRMNRFVQPELRRSSKIDLIHNTRRVSVYIQRARFGFCNECLAKREGQRRRERERKTEERGCRAYTTYIPSTQQEFREAIREKWQ